MTARYFKTRLEPRGPWVPVVVKLVRLPERADRWETWVNGRLWTSEYSWPNLQVIDSELDARCRIDRGYVRPSSHEEHKRMLSDAAFAPMEMKR